MSTIEVAWQTIKLIITLIFIGLVTYYGARWIGGSYAKASLDKRLRVVEAVSLGPGRMVCLVNVAGNLMLLGVTSHRINLLSNLGKMQEDDGKEESNLNKVVAKNPDEVLKGFGNMLVNLLKKRSVPDKQDLE